MKKKLLTHRNDHLSKVLLETSLNMNSGELFDIGQFLRTFLRLREITCFLVPAFEGYQNDGTLVVN